MKPSRSLVPLSVLLLAACGPTISSAYFKQAPPRPPEAEIQLYSTKAPTCPYEEIGLVRGRKTALTTMQGVLVALQKRAREMGGDAIIGLGAGSAVTGATAITKDFATVDVNDGMSGTVIRFTDPDCRGEG